MSKLDCALLNLFNHKVYTVKKVTDALVVSREGGGEGNHALIVDVKEGWVKLTVAEFLE